MGIITGVSWTDHTFNCWWGCTQVSPACANCYAAAFDKRVGGANWGKDAPRRFFGDKHWAEPIKWNREALRSGIRRKVFCASMADVFEDRDDLIAPRTRLLDLIHMTPQLDWLLLTKRPENIGAHLHTSLIEVRENPATDCKTDLSWHLEKWIDGTPPPNVWLGTTVENQRFAEERIPYLLLVPAAVHFLSVEPMLGPIDLTGGMSGWGEDWVYPLTGEALAPQSWPDPKGSYGKIDWAIFGLESGPKRRDVPVEYLINGVRQFQAAGVPVFCKQDQGMKPGQQGRIPDDIWQLKQFPTPALVEAI